MRIAIDIDKTIFDCNSFLYKFVNTYLINQDLEKDLKYKEINANDYDVDSSKFLNKVSRIHNPYFYNVEEGAPGTIKQWLNEGHEVILLSSRPSSKSLVIVLIKCLNKFEIQYSKLIISCNNKAVYCKENGVDILIDDSPYICQNAKKMGVTAILYENNKKLGNRYYDVSGLEIAKSWQQLSDIIKKKKTNKIR